MVLLGTITECCGGTAPKPQIHIGSPKDLSRHEQVIIGGISIFIDKLIDSEAQIDISIAKLLWLKKLSVELG